MKLLRRRSRARLILVLLAGVAGCGARPIQPGAAGAAGSGGDADAGSRSGSAGSGSAGGGDSSPPPGGASGVNPRALGQACAGPADCASGFCADGVCCATACTSGCQTCAAPGSFGVCMLRPAGAAPRATADCAASPPSSCGFDGTCDGAGSCRLWGTATVCLAGQCNGRNVMGQHLCNGLGACMVGPNVVNCVPYGCDPVAGACRDHCVTDDDCTGGRGCVAGSCSKSATAACTQNAECASGFCSEGVCCNVACTGPCVSCALPGKVGTCWPVDVGAVDPRGVCVAQSPATCGPTGTCDGLGACATYPSGTECAPPSCADGAFTSARTCDGAGTCSPAAVTLPCPGACDASGSACGEG